MVGQILGAIGSIGSMVQQFMPPTQRTVSTLSPMQNYMMAQDIMNLRKEMPGYYSALNEMGQNAISATDKAPSFKEQYYSSIKMPAMQQRKEDVRRLDSGVHRSSREKLGQKYLEGQESATSRLEQQLMGREQQSRQQYMTSAYGRQLGALSQMQGGFGQSYGQSYQDNYAIQKPGGFDMVMQGMMGLSNLTKGIGKFLPSGSAGGSAGASASLGGY